jgi:hypothetical protein
LLVVSQALSPNAIGKRAVVAIPRQAGDAPPRTMRLRGNQTEHDDHTPNALLAGRSPTFRNVQENS